MSFVNRNEYKSQRNNKEKQIWQKINGCFQEIKWNKKNKVKIYMYLNKIRWIYTLTVPPVCKMEIISGINVSWALKINLTEERKLLGLVAVTTNFTWLNLKGKKAKKANEYKILYCAFKRRSSTLEFVRRFF